MSADAPPAAPRLSATLLGLAIAVPFLAPLPFVELPPFQDVPGHTAAVHILRHLDRFPGLAATPLFKTNALYFDLGLLLHAVPIKLYAKLFCAAIVLLNGQALPRLVARFRGPAAMVALAPFYAPLVHHWFVTMGMLNFCAALPLSLFLLLALTEEDDAPPRSWLGHAGVLALTAVTWLAHTFPLFEVALFALLRCALAPDRATALRRLRPLLAPLSLLVALSAGALLHHAGVAKEPGTRTDVIYDPLPDLLVHLFTRTPYGATAFTLPGLLLALVPALAALAQRLPDRLTGGWLAGAGGGPERLFGAFAALNLLAYVAIPAAAGSLAHIDVRVVPYLWVAALLLAPPRLFVESPLARPLRVVGVALLALLFGGNFLEQRRLAEDVAHLAAARPLVPVGARLLPLVWGTKGRAHNARPLNSASALYILDRDAFPQDIWTHNGSMPLVRTGDRPARFDRGAVYAFVDSHASVEGYCGEERLRRGADGRCAARFAEDWEDFFVAAGAYFTHLLLVTPPPAVRAHLPAGWSVAFDRDGTVLLTRP